MTRRHESSFWHPQARRDPAHSVRSEPRRLLQVAVNGARRKLRNHLDDSGLALDFLEERN
jgi:hypothetical protein